LRKTEDWEQEASIGGAGGSTAVASLWQGTEGRRSAAMRLKKTWRKKTPQKKRKKAFKLVIWG